jgi:hypothetical protein
MAKNKKVLMNYHSLPNKTFRVIRNIDKGFDSIPKGTIFRVLYFKQDTLLCVVEKADKPLLTGAFIKIEPISELFKVAEEVECIAEWRKATHGKQG